MATCPECRAEVPGQPATVVACPSCGNPVALPAAPEATPPSGAGGARDASGGVAPEAGRAPPAVPWTLAGVVLLVLALAHYGLYLLITANTRSELAALEARHDGRPASGARSPGDAPPANSPAYAHWLEQKERFDDAEAYAEHESQRGWVARGLFMAFLVQVGITAWALWRVAGSRRRRRGNGRRTN